MEYIICEKHNGKWCLFCLAGTNEEKANEKLKKKREEHPELELEILVVASEDCWWRNGCD